MLRLALVVSGLIAIVLIGWVYARRARRTNSAGDRQRPSTFDRGSFSNDVTMPVAVSKSRSQADTAGERNPLDDTRPGKPVQVRQASADDTEPRKPASPTVVSARAKPTKPARRYPDPTDPYANLFPPPRPGDEDYLESSIEEGDTPPAGMKRAESNPDAPPDNPPI